MTIQGELFTRVQKEAGEALRASEAARLGITSEEVDLDGIGFVFTDGSEGSRTYGVRGIHNAITLQEARIIAHPTMPEGQIIEEMVDTLRRLHERALEADILARENPEAAVRVLEVYGRGRTLLGQRAAHQVVESVERGDI